MLELSVSVSSVFWIFEMCDLRCRLDSFACRKIADPGSHAYVDLVGLLQQWFYFNEGR